MVASINFRTFMPGFVAVVAISIVALKGLSSGHGIKNAQVFENFFSNEDIENVLKNQKISSWSHDMAPTTNIVASFLSKDHVNRLLKATGHMEEQEKGHTISIKTMTDTTNMHTDTSIRKEDGQLEVPVDKSAFVFLNSNPDASFVVEGEENIPVREGDLVVFPGAEIRHQTIVDSGEVKIAGPFTVGLDSRVVLGGSRRELWSAPTFCPTDFFGRLIFFLLRFLGLVDPCVEPRRALAEAWFNNGLYDEEIASEFEAKVEEEEASNLRSAKN